MPSHAQGTDLAPQVTNYMRISIVNKFSLVRYSSTVSRRLIIRPPTRILRHSRHGAKTTFCRRLPILPTADVAVTIYTV